MAVRSEDAKNLVAERTQQAARRAGGMLQPPLNRNNLDRAAPWLRGLAGLILIAVSSYSTIAGVQADAAPLELPLVVGIPGAIAAGVVVALFLSLGEWLTSEQAPYVYGALLILDAWYTQRQTAGPVARMAAYHLGGTGLAPLIAFVLSWLLAIAIARFGELLLFGKRR